jgi:hypothetical protein
VKSSTLRTPLGDSTPLNVLSAFDAALGLDCSLKL